jgi:cold shock CspA family protein
MTIKFGDFLEESGLAAFEPKVEPQNWMPVCPAGEKLRGRLLRWFDDRHFGFVQSDEGPSYFVHGRVLETCGVEPPTVGQRVVFILGTRPQDSRPCVTWIAAEQ